MNRKQTRKMKPLSRNKPTSRKTQAGKAKQDIKVAKDVIKLSKVRNMEFKPPSSF